MVLNSIEELREGMGVHPNSIAAAVTTMSRRRDEAVRKAVHYVDMIEDYALFAATCEARAANRGNETLLKKKDEELAELAEIKDAEMRMAVQRVEEEAREREVQRVKEAEER